MKLNYRQYQHKKVILNKKKLYIKLLYYEVGFETICYNEINTQVANK